MISRRIFTLSLFSLVYEPVAVVNKSTDKIVGQINQLSAEYIKLQDLTEKRMKYFSPVNDAPLLGWYEKMADCHEKFAPLFRQLAESLRR